jgi:hypothetical protein
MTRDQAWALVRYLEATFGARVVQRTDAIEYQLVRGVIESATFGIVDIDALLGHYSQTIGPLIYLSAAHVADPDLLASVVVHEVEHVHQFTRDRLRLPWLYLTTQEGRAMYEAQAYSAQYEWQHARTGAIPMSPEDAAMPLEAPAYILSADEVKLARVLLTQRMTAAAQGHYVGAAALAAIAWAKKHAPDLLHHA